MKRTDAKAIIKGIYPFIGLRAKTMADARNLMEGTRKYTSNLKDRDKTKEYIGRGSGSGFTCVDELHNQFIDLNKTDGKWENRIVENKFIESWKDTTNLEEIKEWKEGKEDICLRLFVKSEGADEYVCMGFFYRSGSSNYGILWSRVD
jgi:hypothetical protein